MFFLYCVIEENYDILYTLAYNQWKKKSKKVMLYLICPMSYEYVLNLFYVYKL